MQRFLAILGFLLFAVAAHGSPATARADQPTVLFAAPSLEGQLNLNTASAAQLDLLPGVGPATAAKIIRYRERRPFRKASQLMRIKGIGKKTFARVRKYLAVDGENTLEVVRNG